MPVQSTTHLQRVQFQRSAQFLHSARDVHCSPDSCEAHGLPRPDIAKYSHAEISTNANINGAAASFLVLLDEA